MLALFSRLVVMCSYVFVRILMDYLEVVFLATMHARPRLRGFESLAR
jgi:hypothetical protein